jgi:hypothetical protein
MDIVNEEWRDVAGFEGFYQVSSLGRVRSLDRYVDGKMVNGRRLRVLRRGFVMSQSIDNYGYSVITFSKNGEKSQFTVHRLVAIAFVGGNFQGSQVNHIDGNKSNNIPSNLEFCTIAQNNRHAFKMGLKKGRKGVDHHSAVLTDDDVREIRLMLASGIKQFEIAS